MRYGKPVINFALYPAIWTFLILVLLIVIEGAASWAIAMRHVAFPDSAGRHIHHDALLGWTNQPGSVIERAYGPGADIRINSLGFRGEEIDPVPSEGRVRMVCSGDSFTFGQGVGNGEDWCHVLARMNQQLDPVNMGQPGYGVDQAYLWYLRDGLPMNPDVHVFAFVEGDFFRMLTPVRYGVGKPILEVSEEQLRVANVPVPRLKHTIARTIEKAELRVVRLGYSIRRQLEKRTPEDNDGMEAKLAAVRPVASLLFERLRDINEQQGIATILVYLPTEVDLEKTSPLRHMAESLATDLGLDFVDLTPKLRVLSAHKAARLFLPDGHYTAEGNQWVAEILSKHVVGASMAGVLL